MNTIQLLSIALALSCSAGLGLLVVLFIERAERKIQESAFRETVARIRQQGRN